MAMALHDPEDGYYACHDPLGRTGDFTTAPEISQIFGELIGLWCADQWQRMGRPDPIVVVELGPGRGTLMHDFLRAAAAMPDFRRAMRLLLVEASPVLRTAQAEQLADAAPQFVAGIDELPAGPLLLVANEFLDALPIRQLVRGQHDWAERLVTVDADDCLVFAEGPDSLLLSQLAPSKLRASEPGTVVEICPAALALAGVLGERFSHQSGVALFIDYGYFPSATGATLAALHRHAAVDPLAAPGEADLSAHVDFAAFAEAARATGGAESHGPVPQGRFLAALGVEARLAALSRNASPQQRAALESGVQRLIEPGQMGTLFKALALTSPGLPAPAGFEA
jgi:NADH dehydrogenase [ubiquinone] 1 alpha subcomplex assembly factor 7